MKKLILGFALAAMSAVASAGWFAGQSESYLQQWRHLGNNIYQCVYKTNPGNRGWMQFQVQFNGGCPRVVYYNANNGNVTTP